MAPRAGLDSDVFTTAIRDAEVLAPGARAWEARSSEHRVQFYESDGFLIDSVTDYVGAALRGGHAVVVIATRPHRRALDGRLALHGLDLSRAKGDGQYVALDAADTLKQFMVDGMPDPDRFHQVVGDVIARSMQTWPRLRAFGEMVALLAVEGHETAAVRLESLWNDLQQQRAFTLMCAYPIQQLGGEGLAQFVHDVAREHSRIVPAESYSALDDADARLRAIALLQQKAHALELEIAARERTEQELRRREAELRDFLEQGLIGLHWVDADGKILWANKAELDLLDVTLEEYVGRHIGDFYTDRHIAEAVLARLASRETIRELEVRLRRKDGTIRHALLSSNVLWDGDIFVHTRCFMVDITGRKLAEQRLALQYAVTQALSDSHTLAEAGSATLSRVCETLGWQAGGLWLVDHEAEVLRCHEFWPAGKAQTAEFEAVSRGLALESGTGLPGRVWASGEPMAVSNVVDDKNFPRLPYAQRAGLHSAFAFPICVEDAVIGVVECFSPREETPDDETLAVMAGIGGQIGQFIERKRAEAEAHEMGAARDRLVDDLQRLMTAREEFLASAAHDLKNPLANMKAQAQLLYRRIVREGSVAPERILSGLQSVEGSATRMAALVDDLLDTARIGLGQPIELRRRPTDLVELAGRVVAEYQQRFERHQLRVEAATPKLVGDWDPQRLDRVLSNLLDNAIKYSPDGGDVVVTIQRQDGAAEVQVRDNGMGIPTADLPFVFDRFRRGANVAGRIGGTGIGLAGVRALVESHSGTIGVASTEGVGSTFTVRLPMEAAGTVIDWIS
jgi:PAS domain S-box-containing protein